MIKSPNKKKMETLNESCFEDLIIILDKTYNNLHVALKERNFSSSALESIQSDIINIVSILEEFCLQEWAKSLTDCKNQFNLKTDDTNKYAVIVSNTKKVVSNTKKYLMENKMINFKNTNFLDTSKVDIHTIKLDEYFQFLRDKEILQIIFLKGYFQIYFDRGVISCISETFISNGNGTFQIPSKEGNWELFNIIGKEIISAEEKGNEVILKTEDGTKISVNTRLGPQGDTFHITVEGLPTLHF